MANWPFTRGVHDIGDGVFGYVQPDGTWGWSNAGLVVNDGEALLIDTLMTVPLTREMLDQFRAKVPEAADIGRLMNTHANADHFFGNGLLAGAEIIATRKTRDEMAAFDPRVLSQMERGAPGDASEFLIESMGAHKFDYSGVEAVTLPNRLFEDRLSLSVGETAVELFDLGPAHTASDTIAWLPRQRVVFTGDLLFNEGHPIMWAGPVENWIRACEFIIGLDPEVVVPGHGPITDAAAVARLKHYFEYVRDEARARFDAGVGFEEAARQINLAAFRGWSDPERIVANVYSLYRQWGARFTADQRRDLFGAMGRLHKELAADDAAHGRRHGHGA